MNENRTLSILQRIPVILAVTAASYGLQSQAQTQTQTQTQRATVGQSSLSRPAPSQRIAHDRRLTPHR